jgi:HSP20 family protein
VRPSEDKKKPVSIWQGNLWSEMDRMFDEFRTGFDDLLWPWRRQREYSVPSLMQRRTPPLDVADVGDRYEMNIEMPGIPKDEVNIEVTSTSIEISAEHEESNEDTNKNWLRRERRCLSFYRALEFPEDVRVSDVDAEFTDGVLRISLPKSEPKPEHKPRKVKVR